MTIVRYIDGQCYMFSLTEDELLAAYKWVQRDADETTVLDVLQDNGYMDAYDALMDSPKMLYETAKNFRQRIDNECDGTSWALESVIESLPAGLLEVLSA